MKQTQEEWTRYMLENYGKVSRNDALRRYITRLGAIICDLNKDGWDIKGKWEKYENGRDYVYYSNKGQGSII